MYLQAGPLHIFYEKGFLRQIKHNDSEVVRMIYFALRDHNWGTFDRKIENEIIESYENHFSISYTCLNIIEHQKEDCADTNHGSERDEAVGADTDHGADEVFEWNVKINGDTNGKITFEIQGKAVQEVRRNRAGFCILHPIEGVATQPITIIHDADSDTETHFPQYIAADDPFLNIRAMRWQAASGGVYQLNFEGDIFQTEDQRNWGDASYKTFCTPLSLPFPVQLHKGDTVWQRVTLSVLSASEKTPVSDNREIESKEPKSFALGVAASVETETLSEKAINLLKSLNLSHYRIDLNPSLDSWITDFSNHCENAALLNLPLEIALSLDNEYEKQLADFIGLCRQNRLRIANLLLFSSQSLTTPHELIHQIPHLKSQLPNVKMGIGTNYNFTELNRNRFEAGDADFITFSYHPQVHAFDDLSLMENTETLRYQVESAEKLYAKPVHVSFISLRQRANPYAANAADILVPIDKQADGRQKTEFGAAWVKSVLAHFSTTNVASATIFRTVGELGLLSLEGNPYPIFECLRR
jgi:hypothetical protein